MEGITVLIIMTMAYGFVEILKTSLKNERFKSLIPALSAGFGAILGLIIHFCVPQLTPNSNFVEALIVGICSGLSSTGTHQISKQLQKFKQNKAESNKTATEEDTEENNIDDNTSSNS